MSQATWMSTTSWSLCRTWGQDWHEIAGLFTRSHGLITWPSPLTGPTKHPQSSRFKFIDQGYAICLIVFNDQGNDGKLDCPNVIPFHNHLNKWYPNILQHSSPKTTCGLLDCKQHLHAIWHIEWSMRGLFNLFKTAVINRSEHSDAQNLYRCNWTESLKTMTNRRFKISKAKLPTKFNRYIQTNVPGLRQIIANSNDVLTASASWQNLDRACYKCWCKETHIERSLRS